uniref:Reverse transcriptase Ty1/copia-type domain-containing protein n=1 Tax=Amphimedon queenslandica TaxID=400682 RepID=A0A1X7VSJ3_AMPQE
MSDAKATKTPVNPGVTLCKGTEDSEYLGLIYSRSLIDGVGYSDSDWGGDLDDRKSTSGFVLQICHGPVSWQSRKQSCVALSTSEAEYITLTSAAQEVVSLRQLLSELDQQSKRKITIYEDNQSAICLARNPQFHGRSKHIAIKYHYIRDQVKDGTVDLKNCKTEEMLADIFTKELSGEKFEFLRQGIGVHKFSSEESSSFHLSVGSFVYNKVILLNIFEKLSLAIVPKVLIKKSVQHKRTFEKPTYTYINLQYIVDERKWTFSRVSEHLKQEYPGTRGLSLRSLERFCQLKDIHRTSRFNDITLDHVVSGAINMLGPTYGRKTMTGILRSREISVSEDRVGTSLRRVDPTHHVHRSRVTKRHLNPVPFHSDYFGHKLHIDQNKKLVMFGVRHICAVDGFSGKIVSFITTPVKN